MVRTPWLAFALAVSFLASGPAHAQRDAISGAARDSAGSTVRGAQRDAITAILHKPVLYVDAPADKLTDAMLSPDRKKLLLTFERQAPRVWNFDNGQQFVVRSAAALKGMSLDPTGRYVFGTDARATPRAIDVLSDRAIDYGVAARALVGFEHRSVMFVGRGTDVAAGGAAAPAPRAPTETRPVGFSPDGQVAAIQRGATLDLIFSQPSRAPVAVPLPPAAANLTVQDVRILSDSELREVAYVGLTSDGAYASFGMTRTPVRLRLPNRPQAVGLIDGANEVVSVVDSRTFAISDAAGDTVATGQNDLVGPARAVWSYRDGQVIVVLRTDGRVVGFDRAGKLAFMAISAADQWAVIDGRGRYDASDRGAPNVGWAISDARLDLTHFTRQYFEPGLLALYTAQPGRFLTEGTFDLSNAAAVPPSIANISLLQPSRDSAVPNQVIVTARNVGAPIESIELFHNGKKVPPSAIIHDETTRQAGVTVRGVGFAVQPLAGANEFRAVALGLGEIEGPELAISETFTGSAAPETLHILGIGINRYSMPEMTLGYASHDAVNVIRQFQTAGQRFGRIVTYQLVDSQATRDGILAGFEKVKTSVRPEDTLVIYLAGHGVVLGQEWYFVTQFVSTATAEGLKRAGLSSKNLYDAIVAIPATKVFLMVDACYSGAAAESLDRFAAQREAAMIGRLSGIGVLAASRADQQAAEFSELGDGLFTHVVIRGLKGEADRQKTGMVGVAELIRFAEDVMPQLYRDKLNEPQVPRGFFRGADFYLASTR